MRPPCRLALAMACASRSSIKLRLGSWVSASSPATREASLSARVVVSTSVCACTAATICATTPARELGLVGHGVLAPEAVADLVVLDANFSVVQTYLAGQLVYARNNAA